MSAKQERRRLRKLAKRWYHVLGLDEWRLRTEYVDGALVVDGQLDDAVAITITRWQYRHAVISWNLQKVAESTNREVEQFFLHEAMHVLLNEMRAEHDGDVDHEERVATTLSFVLMRLRKAVR